MSNNLTIHSLHYTIGLWPITNGEYLIGGLLGMGSGLMGSYAAAASVTSENEDGVRILRNRREEGNWLVVLETPNGIDAPWQLIQRSRPQQVVRLNDR